MDIMGNKERRLNTSSKGTNPRMAARAGGS